MRLCPFLILVAAAFSIENAKFWLVLAIIGCFVTIYAFFGAPFTGLNSGAPKLTNMRYVHILSRQRRENYDLKESKMEGKAEDGDPVPIFRSARTSCTTFGWFVPSVRVQEKSGSLIYRHICLMNHEETHQTNPMAPWIS